MPDFSIVIPVYNAEKTLQRCLDSLLVQTYGDFDVHMVENGSTDSSAEICRAYESRDPRFVLHIIKENKGPSVARNIGIDCSAGKHIAFIDSDDYVTENYLEELKTGFENADVVFIGYSQVAEDETVIREVIPDLSENNTYCDNILQLYAQDAFGYTWVKAFKADVIGNCRFSQQLNLMEDEVFACEILTEPRKITVVTQPVYNYVTGNPGSLMSRTHSDYCKKLDVVYRAWINLLNSYGNKEQALVKMANSYVNKCMYYIYEREVDVKEFCNQLADSMFFESADIETEFVQCVKNRNHKKLSRMKWFYNLKNKSARLLKR